MDKRSKYGKKKSVPKPTGVCSPFSTDEMEEQLAKIHTHLLAYEYADALVISDMLLVRNPNNSKALEMRASVATEMSQFDVALQFLNRAIAAEPFAGYTKFLAKAQLLSGKDSLECYEKAIELIRLSMGHRSTAKKMNQSSQINTEESMDIDTPNINTEDATASAASDIITDEDVLDTDLSSIYCSVAELYLTDLCDEAKAEDLCIAAVKSALEADPTNADAHITKARYEMIIDDVDAAKQTMVSSREHWQPVNSAEGAKTDTLQPATKTAASKVLMQVDMHKEAHALLESLLEDDEDIVEVYYLLGWNRFLQSEDHHEQAKEYFLEARATNKRHPCEDEALLEHISEMLEELGPDSGSEESSDEELSDEEAERQLEEEIMQLAMQDNGPD